jgi:hypothetical protein
MATYSAQSFIGQPVVLYAEPRYTTPGAVGQRGRGPEHHCPPFPPDLSRVLTTGLVVPILTLDAALDLCLRLNRGGRPAESPRAPNLEHQPDDDWVLPWFACEV